MNTNFWTVLILVLELIVISTICQKASPKNYFLVGLFSGIVISTCSMYQSYLTLNGGEYQFLDYTWFYFVYTSITIALFFVIIFSLPKKKSPSSKYTVATATNESVILTKSDTVRIIKGSIIVLRLKLIDGGIYFFQDPITTSPTYHSLLDVFAYWKSGDVDCVTGSPCINFVDINFDTNSITIKALPGFLIELSNK